jgi:hypothetical protein
MTARHLGLLVFVIGIGVVVAAYRADRNASFDNGTFLLTIGGIITGGVMALIGLGVAIFG